MKNLFTFLATTLAFFVVTSVYAGDCCDQCGCDCQVRKVCRLKCDVKKIPKVTYSCECEDFCVPSPSKSCGCTCEVDCNGCEKCQPNLVPQCAKVHTKKKLIKHVEMEEKKTYKWVVEYVCDNCANVACACAGEVPAQFKRGGDDGAAPTPPQPPSSSSTRTGQTFYQTLFSTK